MIYVESVSKNKTYLVESMVKEAGVQGVKTHPQNFACSYTYRLKYCSKKNISTYNTKKSTNERYLQPPYNNPSGYCGRSKNIVSPVTRKKQL